jgi:flagellar basal-body rod modification protein FlgD
MYMTPLSNSEIDAYNARGGAQADSTDPKAAQDRFLKLFVAQLSNQDPLNPMDNAQMTTQMAQINTVTGIQQMNATLEALAAQFQAATSMQATQLVGRDVVSQGNGVVVDGGQVRGSFSLTSPADAVQVDLIGVSGALLATVNLGAQTAGLQNFQWMGEQDVAGQVGRIEVRATLAGQSVSATPLARHRVESVCVLDGSIRLSTDSGSLE